MLSPDLTWVPQLFSKFNIKNFLYQVSLYFYELYLSFSSTFLPPAQPRLRDLFPFLILKPRDMLSALLLHKTPKSCPLYFTIYGREISNFHSFCQWILDYINFLCTSLYFFFNNQTQAHLINTFWTILLPTFYILSPLSLPYYPVAKLCTTLCDTMDCSEPGSSILH